jgi:maltose-binding protein MalE
MINLNLFITEDNGTFYFDAEEYNSKTDIQIEEGDLIKFTKNNKKYIAKTIAMSNKKNDFFILEIFNNH